MVFGESGWARICGWVLENINLTKGGWVLYLGHSNFDVIILFIYLIHVCIYLFLL